MTPQPPRDPMGAPPAAAPGSPARDSENEELRKANERFTLVALATNDAVWDWDLSTNAVWWNDGFFKLFGYETVEPGIESWVGHLHPEDKERVLGGIHRVIDEGGRLWNDRYRFERADGTWADILDRGFVMHDAAGRPTRMIGAMMDVSAATQAARAQAALTRVAEAAAGTRSLPELLRSIHEIVATLLPAKNFFIALHEPGSGTVHYPYYVDERDPPPAGPEKLGHGLTALLLRRGRSLLLSSEEAFAALARAGEFAVVGSPAVSWVGIPLVSKEQVIGALVAQSYDPAVRHTERDENILQFVSTQIANAIERKQSEAKLLAADRMASVGLLAAGVAHEINNPLAYVIGNLALLEDALSTPAVPLPPLCAAVAAAREGAERVRQIVSGLKTFSRSDETAGNGDVRLALTGALQMARNEIRHRATLVEDHPGDLPQVHCSQGRLSQVLLNLVVNAAQAIPDGEAAANSIRVSTRQEGDRVVVEVVDTGRGIAAADLPRVFDPFFTTKTVGAGTGLGLFICRNIVDSLGGSISVESDPGRGARVRVSLPVARTSPARGSPAPAPVATPRRARVLVVDDEKQIGALLKRALAAHAVTALTSAAEALSRIRGGEPFDLILCDLMMADLTGMDLHAALLAERPDLARRMVFMSGGAFTPRAREFFDRVGNERVEKPFDLRALRALVDRLSQPG